MKAWLLILIISPLPPENIPPPPPSEESFAALREIMRELQLADTWYFSAEGEDTRDHFYYTLDWTRRYYWALYGAPNLEDCHRLPSEDMIRSCVLLNREYRLHLDNMSFVPCTMFDRSVAFKYGFTRN